MRLRLGTSGELVNAAPALGATAAILVLVLAFEHWVIHRLIVIPALAHAPTPPLWAIDAMIAPELVLLFAAGLRVRSAIVALAYAGIGALIRGATQVALALAGEPGHERAANDLASEFAVSAPAAGIVYLLVVGLGASWRNAERGVEGAT
jgi:hypothetical protein